MLSTIRRPGALALVALFLAASVQAQVDKYVPADTEQIVVVNVKQILESPLVKKHALPQIEKQLKDNKEYQQIHLLTGLDILKDVHSVVAANSGTDGDKMMLVIRGRFEPDRIHKVAEAVAKDKPDEVKITKLGDRHLYEGKQNGKSFYFTFIDGTTMVGAPSKSYVTGAVEGKGGKVNKDLASALEAVDTKQSLYAVGLVPEEARKLIGQADQGPVEAMKKVKTVAVGLNVTRDLAASLQLATGDEKAAKELDEFANQMKGLLAFAAMSNEQIAPFANELLKTLKIQSKKGDVGLSFKMSEEVLEKAIKLIPRPR